MNATEGRPDPLSPATPGATPSAESQPPPANAGPAASPAAQPPPAAAASPEAGWRPAVPSATVDPRRKSPVLAGLLSLMPGLGQVYVGYYKLGFIHIAVFGTVLAILSSGHPEDGIIAFLGIFLGFFFLYSIIDAVRRASFYNQALAGIGGVELPQDMVLPSPGGSIAGGVTLLVVGVVLLTNTLFGFSLEWLEQWWPVIPIAVGAWLLWRGLQERASAG